MAAGPDDHTTSPGTDSLLDELTATIASNDISERIANVLALQAASTPLPNDNEDTSINGIHTALVADAAVNTAAVTARLHDLIPDSNRTNGSHATRAGAIGSTKDKKLTLGPVLNAETPLVTIETADQLTNGDTQAFEEILDSGTFSFASPTIHETVESHGSLIFTTGPTNGVFDEYTPTNEQLNLHPAIQYGVDIVLVATTTDAINPVSQPTPLEIDTAREALTTARGITPTWSDDASNAMQQFIDDFTHHTFATDETYLPTESRITDTVRKFAEAHASLRHETTVTPYDIEVSLEILRDAYTPLNVQWGDVLPPGRDDIDVAVTDREASPERQLTEAVKGVVSTIEEQHENGAPIPTVIEEAVEEGVDESAVESTIENLRQKGEVYEPQEDHLRTT